MVIKTFLFLNIKCYSPNSSIVFVATTSMSSKDDMATRSILTSVELSSLSIKIKYKIHSQRKLEWKKDKDVNVQMWHTIDNS